MTGITINNNAYDNSTLTIILLQKIKDLQAYVTELKGAVAERDSKIERLQEKNAEYIRVINQMRDFTDCEDDDKTDNDTLTGHDLLGTHGKILVIGGQELGVNVMNGIAKSMGFEKNDFEYVDYDKAKDFTDRIRKKGKYSAVIFGACPHKTTAGAGYASAIEKFKQIEGMPFATEARSKSGKLKVTKESFKNALFDVYENLKPVYT